MLGAGGGLPLRSWCDRPAAVCGGWVAAGHSVKVILVRVDSSSARGGDVLGPVKCALGGVAHCRRAPELAPLDFDPLHRMVCLSDNLPIGFLRRVQLSYSISLGVLPGAPCCWLISASMIWMGHRFRCNGHKFGPKPRECRYPWQTHQAPWQVI